MKVFTNGTDTVAAVDLADVPAAWEWSHGVSFVGEGADLAASYSCQAIADDARAFALDLAFRAANEKGAT